MLHSWDYTPYSFGVTYGGVRKLAPRNNTKFLTKMADAEYKNQTIRVVLSTKGYKTTANPKFGVSVDSQICPPGGCPVPPEPSIGIPMLWSKKESWPNKIVPIAGQKVTINANMWIIMDVSPPTLGSMVIYGKLSFQSNASFPLNLQLTVKDIAVYGTLEIAGPLDQNNDTTPFQGSATVTLYGTKGSSLPVVMGEGAYLGSKVIAVVGSITAHGAQTSQSWTRLRTTVLAGSSQVRLSTLVDWKAGDEIVLAPTSYFNAVGSPWSSKTAIAGGSSDEVSTILSVHNQTDAVTHLPYTILTLAKPTNHTHLCTVRYGNSFCGAVGLLTRNVRFVSRDSENPALSSYGYGGNLHVFDYITTKGGTPVRRGEASLINVEFKNFGKINSDSYAVRLRHYDAGHAPSLIRNCAFNRGYNLALRLEYAVDVTFEGNVAIGNWGGGVFVDDQSTGFAVNNNLIVGTRQLPSVLLSTYPWLRPVAGITIQNSDGVCQGNVAAGSEDQGFAIATAMFNVPVGQREACSVTRATKYAYDARLLRNNAKFYDNEAVACRGGLMVVAMSPTESQSEDCAVINGFRGWRSGHTGIMAVDAQAHILISNVLLAENHIGVNIHSYKSTENLFNGIIGSTIIGSLSDAVAGYCSDLPDSNYLRTKECQVFTPEDPLGLLTSCSSVIQGIYRRVGVLLPQWTNKPKTCAIAGRFETCEPPTTPDRLCELPWEKRYGLPVDIGYAEQHIHNTTFLGFRTRSYANIANVTAGSCIPAATTDRSVAIAINPSQFDMQPNVIMSGLQWTGSDTSSRLGFSVGAFGDSECKFKPCSGHNMMLYHDLDGSTTPERLPAQMAYRNPSYVAPYPLCYEQPALSNGLYVCPRTTRDPQTSNTSSAITTEFRQYTALWRDWGPQIIQPIVTKREVGGENRSFASFGPIDDMCAKRFYFSRFPMLFAVGQKHNVIATGTIPNEFLLRWDAPSENDATVVQFFVSHSQAITVLVSNDPVNGFRSVPKGTEYPTIYDPAGTNQRDPYNRYLAVTLRGGAYRYYRFRMVPVAAVTIRMEMTLANFFADTFIANMATLLRITIDRIKITSVRSGSVIADVDISPSNTAAQDAGEMTNQIAELTQLTGNLSEAVSTGAIATALNVTVLEVFAVAPVAPVIVDSTLDVAENDTSFNITAVRAAQVAQSTPVVSVLLTFPSSQPTNQPSGQPSARPTFHPSAQPTSQPSTQPTSQPSTPTSQPSSQPSSQPVVNPTSRPSTQPSSSPTTTPTSHPTSTPTRSPRPTSQPSGTPTSAPSVQPTSRPSAQPIGDPTSMPSAQPSSRPSSVPSAQPSSRPSAHPSSQPSSVPTTQPSSQPSSQPTQSPTRPVPLSLAETSVVFSAEVKLGGVTATDFNTDSAASSAFKSSVVNSTVTGDTSVSVTVFNVTDVLATRRVLTGGAGISVQFRVTLKMLKRYLQGTTFDSTTAANAAYGKFAAAMYSAIDSGAFLTALQSSGLTAFQSATVQASSFSAGAFEVYVVDRTPTATPQLPPPTVPATRRWTSA
jgi:hypothetical protein